MWTRLFLLSLCCAGATSFGKVQTYYAAEKVLNFAVEEGAAQLPKDAKAAYVNGASIASEGEGLKAVFTGMISYSVDGNPCGLDFKIEVATKKVDPSRPPAIPGLPTGGLAGKPITVSYLKVIKMGPLNCAP